MWRTPVSQTEFHRLRVRAPIFVPRPTPPRGVLLAIAISALLASPVLAAPPVLRGATLKVTFADTTTCDVEAVFSLLPGTATSIEHRLQLFEGTQVELLELSGAQLLRPSYASGRTQVLELRPASPAPDTYGLRYRAVQFAERAYRCPLWIPTAPSDGRSLNVQLGVVLPPGAVPWGGGFPALRWGATEGVARLGHVPAFVRVPFGERGRSEADAWNVSRLMDGTAVVLLVAGMVAFIWRKRR